MGQGLAGSLLAYCLLQKGCKIVVIDDANTEGVTQSNYRSSSSIAAGVINPITGKRYVKSWRIDELLPEAREMYQGIEKILEIPIWQERVFIRTLQNVEDENQWLLRSSYADYAAYCNDKSTPSVLKGLKPTIKDFHAFAEIKQAAQVHVPALVKHFRQHLMSQDCYFQDKFEYNDCILKENAIFYKEYKAQKVIFCEGAKGVDNPYFKWLPYNLDKGELLIVKIPHFNLDNIFKHHISIVPLGDDLYWVGATNDWQFKDDQPTEVNKQLIIKELESILKLPFEIIDHQAAIRPTVKDRRPFIGFHPDFEAVAIFNGFGTKGASLIPYWAKQFSDILLSNRIPSERRGDIDKEVNIERYAKAREVV